jgi:hypothetical protein
MSCKIPLSESINIYNHEFEKKDEDLVPVHNSSNKLLIIPSESNSSPGPEFHIGCRNSLNDDDDWSFTNLDGGECKVDRLIKEGNYNVMKNVCNNEWNSRKDFINCPCFDNYENGNIKIPLNEIMSYCKKHSGYNALGLSDKLKRKYYKIKDNSLYSESSNLPSINDFNYGCKSLSEDVCDDNYYLISKKDINMDVPYRIKKCKYDNGSCGVYDGQIPSLPGLSNSATPKSVNTGIKCSNTCKDYTDCATTDNSLETDNSVIWPCSDECNELLCCIPSELGKCYKLGNDVNEYDENLTNREYCNNNCNVYTTTDENLWKDQKICEGESCEFTECCGFEIIPSWLNPSPSCVKVDNETEDFKDNIEQIVNLNEEWISKRVNLSEFNKIIIVNDSNKIYRININVTKNSDYWYGDNYSSFISKGGKKSNTNNNKLIFHPNKIEKNATKFLQINYDVLEVGESGDVNMGGDQTSPNSPSPNSPSPNSPSPNSPTGPSEIDFFKKDGYYLTITKNNITAQRRMDDSNVRSLNIDALTIQSKIYKIFVICLIILFNIIISIIFLKVKNFNFSISFIMIIINLSLLLYLNKLRHNEIIRKDYILDLFKKLKMSVKTDKNLNETSKISKIINKVFSFEEWLSENDIFKNT